MTLVMVDEDVLREMLCEAYDCPPDDRGGRGSPLRVQALIDKYADRLTRHGGMPAFADEGDNWTRAGDG